MRPWVRFPSTKQEREEGRREEKTKGEEGEKWGRGEEKRGLQRKVKNKEFKKSMKKIVMRRLGMS